MEAEADGEGGRPLAFDDLVCGIADGDEDLVHGTLVVGFVPEGGELLQPYSADAGKAPERDLAVPVFTDDVGMDAPGIDSVVMSEKVAEPGSVEDGAGADHPGGG